MNPISNVENEAASIVWIKIENVFVEGTDQIAQPLAVELYVVIAYAFNVEKNLVNDFSIKEDQL